MVDPGFTRTGSQGLNIITMSHTLPQAMIAWPSNSIVMEIGCQDCVMTKNISSVSNSLHETLVLQLPLKYSGIVLSTCKFYRTQFPLYGVTSRWDIKCLAQTCFKEKS